MTQEDNPRVESMPYKGKAVVGIKRGLTEDMSGPTAKQPHVNLTIQTWGRQTNWWALWTAPGTRWLRQGKQ